MCISLVLSICDNYGNTFFIKHNWVLCQLWRGTSSFFLYKAKNSQLLFHYSVAFSFLCKGTCRERRGGSFADGVDDAKIISTLLIKTKCLRLKLSSHRLRFRYIQYLYSSEQSGFYQLLLATARRLYPTLTSNQNLSNNQRGHDH